MRIVLTTLITLFILLPHANCGPGSRRGELVHAQILEVEQRLAAAVRRGDHSTLEGLIADDVRIVDARGSLLGGVEWLAAVRKGSVRLARTIGVPDVRVYDTIALVHGRAKRRRSEAYVLRVWARLEDGWRLVVEHTTDVTERATAEPSAFVTLNEPVPARRTDDAPPGNAHEEDVKHTLRESHRRYWAKNVQAYLRTVGSDLIRVAETGVRPGAELVSFMRDSPHLPRAPSDQLEMWTKVFGNVAIGGWLDEGTTPHGAASRNRFTLALVWRDGRWQIVQMQSTGIAG